MSIVSPSVNKVDLVDQFKELSKTIRKDGILAIEQQVAEQRTILKKGLELIIDGVDAESVKRNRNRVKWKRKVYGSSSKIFKLWGSYAPAFGMVGTLRSYTNVIWYGFTRWYSLGYEYCTYNYTLWSIIY